MFIIRIFRSGLFILCSLAFMSCFNLNMALAANSSTGGICNTNEHCQYGWYCLNGTGNNGNTNFTGVCHLNIVAKQLCTLHKSLIGIFGRFVLLFGVMVLAWQLLQGKFEIKSVLTVVLGAVLIMIPYTLISLITRDASVACNFTVATPAASILPSA